MQEMLAHLKMCRRNVLHKENVPMLLCLVRIGFLYFSYGNLWVLGGGRSCACAEVHQAGHGYGSAVSHIAQLNIKCKDLLCQVGVQFSSFQLYTLYTLYICKCYILMYLM